MSPPVEVAVLIHQPEGDLAIGEELKRAIESRFYDERTLVVEMIPEAELLKRLTALCAHRRPYVIGLLTSSPTSLLEALSKGADEALLLENTSVDLDDFCARLKARVQFRRDRESSAPSPSLEDLVGGIAHEINNPLSTITLGLDILQSSALGDLERLWALRVSVEEGLFPKETAQLLPLPKSEAPETRGLFQDLVAATDSITRLIRAMRAFSSAPDRPQFFQAQHAVNHALLLVKRELGPTALVEIDCPEDLPQVFLPPHRLTQALTGLLFHTCRAIRSVSRDLHRIRIRTEQRGWELSISVSDPSSRPPSSSAVENSASALLRPALAGARTLIEDLGGRIVQEPEGEILVECRLPLPSDEAQASRRPLNASSSFPPPSGNCSILLVDDDPRFLRTVARILKEHCRVLIAQDGAEAKDILARGTTPSAILMEVSLPEIEGPELFDWLCQARPELASHVGFLVGASSHARFADFLRRHSDRVLDKPPKPMSLVRLLRKLAPHALPRSALFAYEAS